MGGPMHRYKLTGALLDPEPSRVTAVQACTRLLNAQSDACRWVRGEQIILPRQFVACCRPVLFPLVVVDAPPGTTATKSVSRGVRSDSYLILIGLAGR